MRNSPMLTAAFALALGSASVFAPSAFAQSSPPSPNAASGTVQPSNSLPAGQVPSQPPGAGGNLGGTVNPPPASAGAPYAATQPGVNSVRPLHSPRRTVRHAPAHRRRAAPAPAADTTSEAAPAVGAPATADGARPGNVPGTGNSLPTSDNASNITPRNTRNAIAPRLPTPSVSANSPAGYLQAADRAIAARRTGAAQEALERAETRALDRSVDPSAANTPDSSALVAQIGEARRALAGGNMAGARSAIRQAMATTN